MSRFLAVLVAANILVFGAAGSAQAATSCPNQPHGKCPPAKTQAAKPAKTKKKAPPPRHTYSRSDFTPQQREEILEYARKLCKKRYGAEATVYNLNYAQRKVTCTNNTR